jgi:hypothetical protein
MSLPARGRCAALVSSAALLLAPTLAHATTTTQTFGCTAGTQTSTVPAGATLATVTLDGAAGLGTRGIAGGHGEELVVSLPAAAGTQFDVNVGCHPTTSVGGFNGGGNGGLDDRGTTGGGGGGASDILPHGGALASLYAIAGGGGGAGDAGGFLPFGPPDGAGGAGGDANADGSAGADEGIPSDAVTGGGGGHSGSSDAAGGAVGSTTAFLVPGIAGGAGAALLGGAGGAYSSYEGGGGGGAGGGWIGGGGGGNGGSGPTDGGGGGGGGGGGDHVAAGVTRLRADNAAVTGDGSVTIVYSIAPDVSLSAASKDFGTVTRGQTATQTVTVTNVGDDPLHVGQAAVTGAGTAQFAVDAADDSCSNASVAGHAGCTVTVRFAPTAAGGATGTLSVPSDAQSGSPATVALSGTGAEPVATAAAIPVQPAASAPEILGLSVGNRGCVASGARAHARVHVALSQQGTIHYALARRNGSPTFARCPHAFTTHGAAKTTTPVYSGTVRGTAIGTRAARTDGSSRVQLVIPALTKAYHLRAGTYRLTVWVTNANGTGRSLATWLRVLAPRGRRA